MCWDEGQLRAYLDGELEAATRSAVTDHLWTCPSCRARLDRLEADARLTASALALLNPQLEGATFSAAQALARLRGRVAQDRPGWSEKLKGRWRTMTEQGIFRRWRPALVTVVVLALVISLFSLESVRTAAAQFLGIFRIRRFAVVSIDPSRIQNLEVLEDNLEGLLAGQWEMIEEPGPPQAVDSVEEASALAGFQVRAPTYLPSGVGNRARIMVEGRGAARLTVDVAQVRALLGALGISSVTLPDGLEQVTVEVEIPPAVVMDYGYGRTLNLVQLESPTVHLPPGLDLAQLGEAMLQVLGLTPAEARQFSQTIDWANTLVIPIPKDVVSFQEVSVDGETGLLLRSRNEGPYPSEHMLLWQKGGIVYGLSGQVSNVDILAVADSLQ